MNVKTEGSILAFIVPRLVIQAENAVSDCLFHILLNYREAAQSLLSYLSLTGFVAPEGLEFSTQLMWKAGAGRPDILGMKDGRVLLVLESKFDAPLTKNQPVSYLEYLPHDICGLLLFLVPARRVEELWDSLTGRCASKRIAVGPRSDAAEGVLAARLNERHFFAVASWESLVEKLVTGVSRATNARAHADIAQLSALCTHLLSGNAVGSPLTDPDRDKRERQLRAMVDQVVNRLVTAGHADVKPYRATPGPGYYKRYMTLSGHINWCVEFNTEYWARFGESLIWLSTNAKWYSAENCAALDARLMYSTRRIRKEVLIRLLTTHARSENESIEQMTVQAAAVAGLLAPSG